jgi:hypothetical protein
MVKLAKLHLAAILIFFAAHSGYAAEVKPYRVLLIISNQWKDPRSFLVSGNGEFQTMVTMFKSWGVPFDILRLDQTLMDPNCFTEFTGKPKYGAILWDVPDDIPPADGALITAAVENLHISLIAISNRVKQAEIQQLLGIRYKGEYMHSAHAMAEGPSFLLRGVGADLREPGPSIITLHRQQVELVEAHSLANAGKWPQITERELGDDTRAIWIGGDSESMLLYQSIRTVLRRAITEAIGYSLEKTWTRHIVLTMDDLGNAQNAWLEHWHYRALTQEQIERYILQPLKAHNAMLSINAVPGFVDDAQRKIVPSWQQQFTDEFGIKQDYVSTKKGLDEGVAAGLIEIESHGWTHMQPDLSSDPGWWGTPIDGERAEIGWYREFYDLRRDKEIPAAEQKFRMHQSAEWLRAEFGFYPLEFSTGGNAVSRSPDNNTWRLAAESGFGYYGGYLGKDMAVEGRADSNADFGGSDDVPLLLPALPDGHDRGVSHDPEGFARVFDKYPGYEFIGMDEYIGYQHADLRTPSVQGGGLKVAVAYDPHYCRALIEKKSTWDLNLSDWMLSRVKSWGVWADGKKVGALQQELTAIPLDAGLPSHTIELRP